MHQDIHTRASLADDLRAFGIRPGDIVMPHASLRSFGTIEGGRQNVLGAFSDVVGPEGTILVYTDWDADYEVLLDADGCVPEALRDKAQPFDRETSPSAPDNGALAELVRTSPGALRSANPGASFAALGARAEWLTQDQPIDYGYGEGSPLAKLVEAGGQVLMMGAPLETMTLLHHAEHLAKIPGKRIRRVEVPFATSNGVEWRMVEEFETAAPVVEGLSDEYFAAIVEDYLVTGKAIFGEVGDVPVIRFEAADILAFAVEWIEEQCG